ncbi:MAG TPA: FAD-dependent oxidoreductase [Solirubrobacteraceae bacterium]|nr:FAD-dependent oxidoreductase [Solirubrobacteraceae bacterium]
MTEPKHPIAGRVVIVGGGVAGLEALLALRALAAEYVQLTLVSPNDQFVDRPMTVAEPFGFGSAAHHSLANIAAESGAEFHRETVTAVDGTNRRVSCADGSSLAFDTLILALGARGRPPFSDAITFGFEGSADAVRSMLGRLRRGEGHTVAFVAPTTRGWLLPLYELALMTARELAHNNVDGVELRVVSPEARPLGLFGDRLSDSVGRLLATAGIEFVHASFAELNGGELMYEALGHPGADYVVTLPLLSGPGLAGVPTTEPDGFIPVDEYGRVTGLTGVYAAGDAVDFPIKQGGLAAQQADSVAEHVAAGYGAAVEPAPFRPTLRGMLFSGDEPLFMRSGVPGADPDVPGAWYPLWWPPTKVAGRYLAPYLFERSEEEGLAPPPVGFVDVDVPLAEITLPG